MLKAKSCYRCDGDVYRTGETELNETTCLQCGAVQYSTIVKIDSEIEQGKNQTNHKNPRRKAV
tara:strand:+ start:134 stop:322 length:189 start_codon:yes stop_codon:yes gene_type:complete